MDLGISLADPGELGLRPSTFGLFAGGLVVDTPTGGSPTAALAPR